MPNFMSSWVPCLLYHCNQKMIHRSGDSHVFFKDYGMCYFRNSTMQLSDLTFMHNIPSLLSTGFSWVNRQKYSKRKKKPVAKYFISWPDVDWCKLWKMIGWWKNPYSQLPRMREKHVKTQVTICVRLEFSVSCIAWCKDLEENCTTVIGSTSLHFNPFQSNGIWETPVILIFHLFCLLPSLVKVFKTVIRVERGYQ